MRHGVGDVAVGQPLCPECFDYISAVLFNAHVNNLWDATRMAAFRALARLGLICERELRDSVRLSFFKAAEFQRRGLVHLHVVARVDGAGDTLVPPPVWVTPALVCEALASAASTATTALPEIRDRKSARIGWGAQFEAHEIEASANPADAVASYVAGYCTKSSEDSGVLARPIPSLGVLGRSRLSPHARRLVETAWHLADERGLAHLRLRSHAHTFGYRGTFTSKSRRFSTTFTQLRQARCRRAGELRAEAGEDSDGESFEVESGAWSYVGRGYRDPQAQRLAIGIAGAVAAGRKK